MRRESVTDARGEVVRVGDRVAAAVSSWSGPALVVGRVERFTAARTSVRVETHTSHFHEDVSVIDDSLKRFVKLPEAPTSTETLTVRDGLGNVIQTWSEVTA